MSKKKNRIESRKRKFMEAYGFLLESGFDMTRRPKYKAGSQYYRAWQSANSHARYLQQKGQSSWFSEQGISLPPLQRKIRRNTTAAKKTTKPRSGKVAWLPRDEWENQTRKFYSSQAWKELRYEVLRNTGGSCCCCGARASDGVRLHVDHIKPRSKYPELQLDIDNLQVLCEDCNIGKSNYYNDDWRVKMQ